MFRFQTMAIVLLLFLCSFNFIKAEISQTNDSGFIDYNVSELLNTDSINNPINGKHLIIFTMPVSFHIKYN